MHGRNRVYGRSLLPFGNEDPFWTALLPPSTTSICKRKLSWCSVGWAYARRRRGAMALGRCDRISGRFWTFAFKMTKSVIFSDLVFIWKKRRAYARRRFWISIDFSSCGYRVQAAKSTPGAGGREFYLDYHSRCRCGGSERLFFSDLADIRPKIFFVILIKTFFFWGGVSGDPEKYCVLLLVSEVISLLFLNVIWPRKKTIYCVLLLVSEVIGLLFFKRNLLFPDNILRLKKIQ